MPVIAPISTYQPQSDIRFSRSTLTRVGFNPAITVDGVRFSAQPANAITLQERFLGAFMGLAAGDALGCNLETLTPGEIQKRHGIHREITGGQPTPNFHTWAKGATTDDTDMTLMLADSLIQHPGWNPWNLRDRFVAWNNTHPPGRGKLTIRVLGLAEKLDPTKDDFAAAGKQAWQETGRATNGSLMRCSPIALLFHDNPKKLKQVSLESSALTHYAPDCQASTLAYNRVLADVVNGKITDQASIQTSFEAAATEAEPMSPETAAILRQIPLTSTNPESLQNTVWEWIQTGLNTVRKTVESVSPDLANLLRKLPGFSTAMRPPSHALVALKTSMQAFYRHTNIEEALVDVVNQGGDTDTNAAIVGALMGARYGFNAVPARWRSALLESVKIEQTAQKLYETHQALKQASETP